MPHLLISSPGEPPATHPIRGLRTRIGRSASNDIVLPGTSVSGAHAVLLQTGTTFAIEDLGSANGTFVDGSRVGRADLADGSVVRIGESSLKLVAHRAAMSYEPTMLVRPGLTGRKAYLQRIGGEPEGEVLELNKVVCTVGKPGESLVTFIRRGDDVAVRFTDGAVVPRLNGEALAGTPVLLRAGDVLEAAFGTLKFCIDDVAA